MMIFFCFLVSIFIVSRKFWFVLQNFIEFAKISLNSVRFFVCVKNQNIISQENFHKIP